VLSAQCFFNIELIFLLTLGFLQPILLPFKKMRKKELQEEKVVELFVGKIKSDASYFMREESFIKLSYDIEKYIVILALMAKGKLKIRSDTKSANKKGFPKSEKETEKGLQGDL